MYSIGAAAQALAATVRSVSNDWPALAPHLAR
jgi:hypothetical protein